MPRGAELLYTYGILTPADALLFYGFALRTEDTPSSIDHNHQNSARQIWRRELLFQLGLPLSDDAYAPDSDASKRLATILAEYDAATEKLQAVLMKTTGISLSKPDPRANSCLQVLRAERSCLASE